METEPILRQLCLRGECSLVSICFLCTRKGACHVGSRCYFHFLRIMFFLRSHKYMRSGMSLLISSMCRSALFLIRAKACLRRVMIFLLYVCSSALFQHSQKPCTYGDNTFAARVQVSPHELFQAISVESNRRYRSEIHSDPAEFMVWFLNRYAFAFLPAYIELVQWRVLNWLKVLNWLSGKDWIG